VIAAVGQLELRLRAVHGRPLPPHHVLPRPRDDAFASWQAPGAVDVPSDGQPHTVALDGVVVAPEVRYSCVGWSDPKVFREIAAPFPAASPWCAGPVDVSIRGAHLRVVPWEGAAAGGALTLGLGVEEGLRVVRQVRYTEESAGLLGGSRRIKTEVQLEVASSLSAQARIRCIERVPVSASDAARVEILSSAPAAEPVTERADGLRLEGVHALPLAVAPGGRATATLRYQVTLGAKDELVGGDRRG
jgi:hypothetical protein